MIAPFVFNFVLPHVVIFFSRLCLCSVGALQCDNSSLFECNFAQEVYPGDVLQIRNWLVWLVSRGPKAYPGGAWEKLIGFSLQYRTKPSIIRCPAGAASMRALELLASYGLGGSLEPMLPAIPKPLASVFCSGWPLFGLMDMIDRHSNSSNSLGSMLGVEHGGRWAAFHALQSEVDFVGRCPFPSLAVPVVFDGLGDVAAGMRMCVRPPWQQTIVEQRIFEKGEWEECNNLLHVLLSFHASGAACKVVDVGANIGACTLAFASHGFSIVAFEPIPSNLALLRASLDMLPERFSVEVRAQVVSDRPDMVHMTVADAESRVANPKHPSSDSSRASLIEVPATTLDAAVSDVCGLKIDAEGSEFRVFRGARNLLQTIRVVDFEFVPTILREEGEDPENLLHMLDELGFSIWHGPDTLLERSHLLNFQRVCKGWGHISKDMFQAAAVWQPEGFQLLALEKDLLPPACG